MTLVVQNTLSMIYNAFRDSLCQIMSETKYSVRKEVPKLLNNGTDERPADNGTIAQMDAINPYMFL